MPKINVYIRDDNLEKWKRIANKSEWFNSHLEEVEIPPLEFKIVDAEGTIFRVAQIDGELKIVGAA